MADNPDPGVFDLSRIKTLVLVMMENRSFDHVLGHLSLPPISRTDVEGLSADALAAGEYDNVVAGEPPHRPWRMTEDNRLPYDLPHEREFVATQLGDDLVMNGFVAAYYAANSKPNAPVRNLANPPPIAFCDPSVIPITSFLAANFCVCDRWFAPLPASTMPNRLMALAGDSVVDRTGHDLVLDTGPLVIDWLAQRNVSWRVYHDGLFSFFSLFLRPEVVESKFRRFTTLAADLAVGDVPEVILIEPTYHDAPHFHANDNHPPLQLGPGEHFLRAAYDVLSRSASWADMLVVFTSDEHGGFFDAVKPLPIPYQPANGKPFATTGPRVPAIVASPFVTRKSFHGNLDHTSFLQLLAERFDPNAASGYSPTVEARRKAGIGSVSALLDPATVIGPAPVPPEAPKDKLEVTNILQLVEKAPAGEMAKAFLTAGEQYMAKYPEQARERLPELWHLLR